MSRYLKLICFVLILFMFSISIFAKDSFYGVGYTIETDLHGYVGTVRFGSTSEHSKLAFHALNKKFELVVATKTAKSLDFIRLFKGELEYKSNDDGFELITGDSYGLEFSSTQPVPLGGVNLYWGYFTGIKIYNWDAFVWGDAINGKHWMIPGGVDIGIEIPASSLLFTIGGKGGFAFGTMTLDNLTTGEALKKLSFGYEHQIYATLAIKL